MGVFTTLGLLVAIFAACIKGDNSTTRIIGGNIVDDEPSILRQEGATCWIKDTSVQEDKLQCGCTWFKNKGASFDNEKPVNFYVITHEACVKDLNKADVRVVLRDRDRSNSDEDCRKIAKISWMKKVNKRPLYVIKLAAIPSGRKDADGENCVQNKEIDCGQKAWGTATRIDASVSGWGLAGEEEIELESIMRKTDIRAYKSASTACRSEYGSDLKGYHTCARARGTTYKGICYGDAGGPMMSRSGKIIGISSRLPEECTSDKRWSVYVKFTNKTCKFINQLIKDSA